MKSRKIAAAVKDEVQTSVAAPAIAAPTPVLADPQVGGRFERLPDGTLRSLDEPAPPADAAAPHTTTP